jgi:hypothetical protein
MVNLDDTRQCPIGPECESCGRLDELAVVTGDTPAGIVCMTLCDDCEVAGLDPDLHPGRGDRPCPRARSARGRRHREMTGEGDLQSPLRPDGRWVAFCPECGFELAEGKHQDRVERKAARRTCPVCREAEW